MISTWLVLNECLHWEIPVALLPWYQTDYRVMSS
jgi:hypothetical protein